MSEYFTRAATRAGRHDLDPTQVVARAVGVPWAQQHEIEELPPDTGVHVQDGERHRPQAVEAGRTPDAPRYEQTTDDPALDHVGTPTSDSAYAVGAVESVAPVPPGSTTSPPVVDPEPRPLLDAVSPDITSDGTSEAAPDLVPVRPAEPGGDVVTLRGAAPDPMRIDDRPSRPAPRAEDLRPDATSLVPAADDAMADENRHGRADPVADRLAAADAFMFGLLERPPIEVTGSHDDRPDPARTGDESAPPTVVIQTVSVEIVDDRSRPDRPRPTGLLAPSRWCGTTWGW